MENRQKKINPMRYKENKKQDSRCEIKHNNYVRFGWTLQSNKKGNLSDWVKSIRFIYILFIKDIFQVQNTTICN